MPHGNVTRTIYPHSHGYAMVTNAVAHESRRRILDARPQLPGRDHPARRDRETPTMVLALRDRRPEPGRPATCRLLPHPRVRRLHNLALMGTTQKTPRGGSACLTTGSPTNHAPTARKVCCVGGNGGWSAQSAVASVYRRNTKSAPLNSEE